MTVFASLADTLYGSDVALFQSIHTTTLPSAAGLNLARIFAEAPVWVTVFVLAAMIMLPAFSMRLIALKAGILALAALAINVAIALFGIGHGPSLPASGLAGSRTRRPAVFPAII